MSGTARGANLKAFGCFEGTPGVVPAAGASWFGVPLASHTLGEERPLIESDLLGLGREMQDPTADVATDTGSIVVPVDARNFGHWLKLFFGAPVTAAAGADFNHVFTSGALALPSMALEFGHPEIPSWSVNRGGRGDTLKIGMARSGLLNADCGLIFIGETDPANASAAGNAATPSLDVKRFAQAAGSLKKDGAALGSVVKADFTFSNQLEAQETIQPDGRIEDSDPGMVKMGGTISVLYKTDTLYNQARAGTPMALDCGWTAGEFSLNFHMPRIFLPQPKRTVSGPKGIQVDYTWMASGAAGASVVATLVTDVAAY